MDHVRESEEAPTGASVAAPPPPREAGSDPATNRGSTDLATSARERAAHEIDRRSTQAGERVGGAAADAREIAVELRRKGRIGSAELLEEVAGQMDDVGGYLKRVDMEALLADIRAFGRRRPGMLVAGAAVAGIAAGRILKASEPASTGGGSSDG